MIIMKHTLSRFTFEPMRKGDVQKEITSHTQIPEGAYRLGDSFSTKYHVWRKANKFYFWEKE